jgi:hypothetical protein
MTRVLPATWSIDFALVAEREKNTMQEESYELDALSLKLWLGDNASVIETYIHTDMENITELDLSIDKLGTVHIGINYAQGCDLNVDMHSIDVESRAPPTL